MGRFSGWMPPRSVSGGALDGALRGLLLAAGSADLLWLQLPRPEEPL